MRFYDVTVEEGAKRKVATVAVVGGLVLAVIGGTLIVRLLRPSAPAPMEKPRALTREERETLKKLEELEKARKAVYDWYALRKGSTGDTSVLPPPAPGGATGDESIEAQLEALERTRRRSTTRTAPLTDEEIRAQLKELDALRKQAE
jgi:hypothetical protein